MANHQFDMTIAFQWKRKRHIAHEIKMKRITNLMSSHGVCAHRCSIIDEERIKDHLKGHSLRVIIQMKTDECKRVL